MMITQKTADIRVVVGALVLGMMALLGAATAAETRDITVDTSKKHQVIHGFGSCLLNFEPAARDVYKKKAFQKLYVEDLGCSLVRLQLKSSVYRGGEKTNWKDISFRDFSIPDGFTGETAPALRFAEAVYKLNPTEVRVFASIWSPPAWMKTNGKTTNGGRLRRDRYTHYAKYLVEWYRYLKIKHGITLYAISVQNELRFVEPYDSCLYTAAEFRDAVKAIGAMFELEGIDIRIMGPEHMTHRLNEVKSYVKAVTDDPAARKHFDIFASHGYLDGVQASLSTPAENAATWTFLKPYGVEFWMTETSGGGTGAWISDGKTRDKKGRLKTEALNGTGVKIHNTLVYGNASAWTYWQITRIEKNIGWGLMILDKPTKKYYASMHFYRHIRPGAYRVETTKDAKTLLSSAYLHEKNKTVTVVLINRGAEKEDVTLNIKSELESLRFSAWVTDKDRDFKVFPVSAKDGGVSLTMPALSMVTILGKVQLDSPAAGARKAE
jgi:O-glycosyl hydrolase